MGRVERPEPGPFPEVDEGTGATAEGEAGGRFDPGYEVWLRSLFPNYVGQPFAAHHRAFWEWVWAVEPGVSPPAFIAIWPRGGAKSTSVELACIALAARNKRAYGLYISATQDQADDHVQTIASMLESEAIEEYYPTLGGRRVGKYGHSRGWRRNRLWTANGFIIDAIGLDTAGRGIKLEHQRPDLIILDDIDGELDTMQSVEKNVLRISKKLLPAGASDVAVLAVQNLVIPHGVFARLARIPLAPETDMLRDRIISGPIPAVEGLAYEQTETGYMITAGTATWEGQSIATCQEQMSRWGLTAFREEAQHEVDVPDGGMFSSVEFRHIEEDELPELVGGAVWVDPAVTDSDQSDAHGICAASLGENGVVYIQRSWEARTSPLDSIKRAISMAMELKIDRVGVETDQGGDTWFSVYEQACFALGITRDRAPRFVSEKAGSGYGSKVHRAGQMLADYERGRIVHVIGTHLVAERALRRFPVAKPYDYADSQFWAWNDCRKLEQSRLPMRWARIIW